MVAVAVTLKPRQMKFLCKLGVHNWSAFDQIIVYGDTKKRPCLDCDAILIIHYEAKKENENISRKTSHP